MNTIKRRVTLRVCMFCGHRWRYKKCLRVRCPECRKNQTEKIQKVKKMTPVPETGNQTLENIRKEFLQKYLDKDKDL
jgi:hypothetical protein